MLVLLATLPPSAFERVRQIPLGFWVRLGVIVLAIVAVVLVWRKVAAMNKVVLSVIVGIAITTLGFNWIYERNEPTWATPAVRWLGGFLPTKGVIETKKAGL